MRTLQLPDTSCASWLLVLPGSASNALLKLLTTVSM
jgi:hypothetical protein